jgi:3-oxoacyl-[acyl-carrier protein] reductase
MNFMEQLFNLKDKVVVVTGANGQLGNTICRAFRETGSKVIGIDLNIDNNRIDGVEYFRANITKKDELSNVFMTIMKKYKAFDILINNAGVSTFEPFEVRPEDKIDWVMDVNLKGSFFCIQSYVNLFDEFKLNSGSIINIASIYGMISPDFRIYTDCDRKNSEIYGATKAGVIQLTKYFAVHLADRNIRVNAVSPGGIFNPKNPQGEDFIKNYSFRCPMKRMANEEELVGALIYLASDAASYTNGVNVAIDGGMSCW